MAKHLMIGNEVAVSYSSGVLADGAVDIQKLSASGPTSMLPGDTIADSAQFRIVQGNGTTNVVSPWVYGKDVINWSGKTHVAQVAEVAVATISTNAAAVGKHRLKVINLTNGAEPYDVKSYEIDVDPATNDTPTEQGVLFLAAIVADLPHWVKGVTHSSGALSFTGYKKGEVKADGSVQEDLVHMTFGFETEVTATGAMNTQSTVATTYSTAGLRGYGDGFYVKDLEDRQFGLQSGFYLRGHLPNTPAAKTNTASPYSMYHIAATKDGSSASQINGVDNIIEINIAFDNGTVALTSALEGLLNPYLLSAGFANVNL